MKFQTRKNHNQKFMKLQYEEEKKLIVHIQICKNIKLGKYLVVKMLKCKEEEKY